MAGEKATQKTSLRTKAEFFTNEAENHADKFKSKYPFFKVDIMPNQRGHSRLVMLIIIKIYHRCKFCIMQPTSVDILSIFINR